VRPAKTKGRTEEARIERITRIRSRRDGFVVAQIERAVSSYEQIRPIRSISLIRSPFVFDAGQIEGLEPKWIAGSTRSNDEIRL
jgi:hypothetical protein